MALAALLVGALIIAVAAALISAEHREAQRWKHGGDRVHIEASVAATSSAGLPAALARLGVPSVAGINPPSQMFVVHASWKSPEAVPGSYEFILLDSRVAPPKPIRGYDAWTADGRGFGPNWDGRYEALAKHYAWLRRTASVETDAGWTNDTEAFGYSTEAGTATMTFTLDRDALPVGDSARDLTLAVALVSQDGEVRWAKKVALTTAP